MARRDDDLRPVFHLALPLPILTLPMLFLGSLWGLRRVRRGPWSWAVLWLLIADATLLGLALAGPELPDLRRLPPPAPPREPSGAQLALSMGPLLGLLALVLVVGALRERDRRGALWVALAALPALFLDLLLVPLLDLGLAPATALALVLVARCALMGALVLQALARLGIDVAESLPRRRGRTFLLGLAYLVTLMPRAALIAVFASALAGLDLAQVVRNPIQDLVSDEPPAATALALLLLVVVLVPLTEELLMRGLVLGWLRRWSRDGVAVGLSALVFALMHPLYGPRMVVPFVYGVVFGWARLRSGGLGAPILLHMFVNGFVMLTQSLATGGP